MRGGGSGGGTVDGSCAVVGLLILSADFSGGAGAGPGFFTSKRSCREKLIIFSNSLRASSFRSTKSTRILQIHN